MNRIVPLILAGALLAAGCRNAPDPQAEAREWARERAANPAGPAAAPDWVHSDKFGPPEQLLLKDPQGEKPQDAAGIVRALESPKAGQRILGLLAAWEKRPPQAVRQLTLMALRDRIFAQAAVEVLAGYPDPAGRRALVDALNSRLAEARKTAATALAWRGIEPNGRTEKKLLGMLGRDGDWRVRSAAARALGAGTGGRFGRAAELALSAAMADAGEFDPVRLECAASLARAKIAAGWDFLREAALSDDGLRAIVAVVFSAELGGRRGAAILGAALSSHHTEVWTAAVRYFPMVGREAALEALAARVRDGGQLGHRAALALAPIEGQRLVPEVLRALEEGSAPMRAAACLVLARTLGAAAVPALEKRLLNEREATSVRLAAATALLEVGGLAAAASLRTVADNDADRQVRAFARDALRFLEARFKESGEETVSDATAERVVFSRWRLLELLGGRLAGCRLRDEAGREKTYYVGDGVALGYTLARVMGAGEEADAPEVLMAGRTAARTDLLRVVLVKGNRSVVLARRAIETKE